MATKQRRRAHRPATTGLQNTTLDVRSTRTRSESFRNSDGFRISFTSSADEAKSWKEQSDFWMGVVQKFTQSDREPSMSVADLMDAYDLTRRRLTALFRKMDEDNGGSISKEEFREGLAALGLIVDSDQDYEDIFSRIDTSGDGDIELDEFFESMRYIRLAMLLRQKTNPDIADHSRMLIIDWNERETCLRQPLKDPNGQSAFFFGERDDKVTVRWAMLHDPSANLVLKLSCKYRIHPVAIEDLFKLAEATPLYKQYEANSFLLLPVIYYWRGDKNSRCEDSADSDIKGTTSLKQTFIDQFFMRPKEDRYAEISENVYVSNVALCVSGPPNVDTALLVQSAWRPMFPEVAHTNDINWTVPPTQSFSLFRGLIAKLRSSHVNILKTGDSNWLMYHILDVVIESYMPILRATDSLMDCIHLEIQSRTNKGRIVDISNLANMRRDLVVLGRAIRAAEQVVEEYVLSQTHLSAELATFYQEIRDRLRDTSELCNESYQRCLELLDQYRTLRDERVDITLFRLTILTAIFIPVSILSGAYGMNFVDLEGHSSMPFMIGKNNWYYWFAGVIIATILICLFFWMLRPKLLRINRKKAPPSAESEGEESRNRRATQSIDELLQSEFATGIYTGK